MKPTVALSMIVKNGAKDLPDCLVSVRDVVDEIVIADTGSTDQSIEVARAHGARVVHIPWEDDFAAARNASLADVHSDWVLVLDADEQLDDDARVQLSAAMEASGVEGYLVTIRNYVESLNERLWDKPAVPNDGRLSRAAHFAGYLPHENVRLFRRKEGIYFEGRVHETVGSRVQANGGALAHADFLIHHFGFVASPETKAAKNLFYRDLGRKKITEMPASAQAHFELGLVEFDNFHNDPEALRLFTRACELNERFAVAWFFRGLALSRLQRFEDSVLCFQRARQLGADPVQCWAAEADALYNSRRFEDARRAYRRGLERRSDPAITSKLGLVELRLGHTAAGLKKLQAAIAREKSPELFDRLITGLVYLNRINDAALISEEKAKTVPPSPSLYIRTAALWVHATQPQRAISILESGIKRFPCSSELLETYAQLTSAALPATEPTRPTLKLSDATPIGKQNKLRAEPTSDEQDLLNRDSEKEHEHGSQHT